MYLREHLCTLDDLQEGSAYELPAFLETGVEHDAWLLHLQLDQQHLGLHVPHVIKHLAKVITFLKETEGAGSVFD